MRHFQALSGKFSGLMLAGSMLVGLAGCAALQGNPIPPEPPRPSLQRQQIELANAEEAELERNEQGRVTGYMPLTKARDEVRAAVQAPGVSSDAGEALDKAKAHLDAADVSWGSVGDPPKPATLATVRHEAYMARRWAQIARAQAGREEGLGRLSQARSQFDAREANDQRWLGSYLVPNEFGSLDFATGTARLTGGSSATVDKLAEFLKQHPRYGLRISGHTDSAPPSSGNLKRFLTQHEEIAEADPSAEDAAALYNLDMSRRRAAAVKQSLMSAGIEADRMDVFAFGQSQPRASNDSAAGRRKNRRVEVLVVRVEEAREQAGAETVKGLGLN